MYKGERYMYNAVIVPTAIEAKHIDKLNRTAIADTAVPNGTPLTLAFTKEFDVFKATPATAETPKEQVWFALSPEVMKVIVGEIYAGRDPRYFTNVAKKPFDVIKLRSDDVLQVTVDFFADKKDPKTVSGATVVELGESGWEAKVSPTPEYKGLSFKIGMEFPMTFGSPMIGEEEYPAYIIEVQ